MVVFIDPHSLQRASAGFYLPESYPQFSSHVEIRMVFEALASNTTILGLHPSLAAKTN